VTDIHAKAFKRIGNALVPADLHAAEFLETLPIGREVLVSINRARSVQHHRLLFGVLRKVCRNSEIWTDEEELLDAVKLATGCTEPRMTLDGEIYRAPKSINFASMGQDAFNRFFKRALYVLGRMIGVDPMTLLSESKMAPPSMQSTPIAPATEREKERAA
jgi:hypothetical protein